MYTRTRPSHEVVDFNPSDLLTPERAAAVLGLSPRTLAAWRGWRRNILPYVKVGGRVRYRRQDVAAFLSSRRRAVAVEE
ncbi:helix-turn-helix domain-containing protein [Pseudomonas nitroreducens]|uniref:helix-turn-helix domain-containing protein n=1 Tax=Pseudomonas nitroreducens TaxID=46680 RepID=UPI002FE3EA33